MPEWKERGWESSSSDRGRSRPFVAPSVLSAPVTFPGARSPVYVSTKVSSFQGWNATKFSFYWLSTTPQQRYPYRAGMVIFCSDLNFEKRSIQLQLWTPPAVEHNDFLLFSWNSSVLSPCFHYLPCCFGTSLRTSQTRNAAGTSLSQGLSVLGEKQYASYDTQAFSLFLCSGSVLNASGRSMPTESAICRFLQCLPARYDKMKEVRGENYRNAQLLVC